MLATRGWAKVAGAAASCYDRSDIHHRRRPRPSSLAMTKVRYARLGRLGLPSYPHEVGQNVVRGFDAFYYAHVTDQG